LNNLVDGRRALLFVLVLILLVLLFGRNVVLELLRAIFIGWLDSVLVLFDVICLLCHVALLFLVYPVMKQLAGETTAQISFGLVVVWQGFLLWQRYKRVPSDPVDEEKERNAKLWRDGK